MPTRLSCLLARIQLWWLTAERDRGDVPGWVMITLMTAGLVVLLTALATAAFGNIFDKAMHSVCPSC